MNILSNEAKDKIIKQISFDEGFVPHLYKCIKGFNTIGYGFNLDSGNIPIEVADFWIKFLIEKLNNELPLHISCYSSLNDARKSVLINMAYQMGLYGLLKFNNFLAKLDDHNYEAAAFHMKDSRWYRDFPNRASRLVNIMIKGSY